jgi:hypothetical protein
MNAHMRACALFAAALLFASPAAAEGGGLGGFFQQLFGGPQPAPRPAEAAPSPRPVATPRKVHKHSPPREARAPAAPATPSPTASKFVYVLGDSLAIEAADGMLDDLQSHPDIGVVDRARDASGLVRDDYFDWLKAARDLLAPQAALTKDLAKDKAAPAKDKAAPDKEKDAKAKETKETRPEKPKVDFVVIMLGINDMQQMRDGKDYVDPLTDRWKEIYAQRIQAMVAPFAAAHVPVVWIGLPPMRSDKFNAQMIQLNQLYKENAERAGAKFIDIFDDFADQSGGFDAFGPNIEGQKAKLRGSDGIHFSSAGSKKLAHFIDAEALAALGGAVAPASTDGIASLPPDIGKAADDINDQIRREMGLPADHAHLAPAQPKPEAGAIASLAARPSSPGAALATPATAPSGEALRLLRAGEPPHVEPGRADDFSR